jgi:hypothetical protein
MFTPSQIDLLLVQRSISDQQPWASDDSQKIDGFYRGVCAAVGQTSGALSRIEWGHYGAGYASFIDAWFYKPEAGFKVDEKLGKGSEYKGLVVLLSRLSPYFVFMEGEKRWHAKGGSSYLPESAMLDRLLAPAIVALAAEVQVVLESHGLVRLFKADLSAALPPDIEVPTILADQFTQYDALYYWED